MEAKKVNVTDHSKAGQQQEKKKFCVTEPEPNLDTLLLMECEPPLFNETSEFQKIIIAKNKWWDKVLWLDDVVNCTMKDEFIYHEMIVHVPMMTHKSPKTVLIVGGGDGGAAREVLKHPTLEKVVMIDIDGVVVQACREHIPEMSNGAFDHPKMELIIGDGIEYVKNAMDATFDVIILDSTDPNSDSISEGLFTKEFYQNCVRILTKDGVFTAMTDMPMRYDHQIFKRSINNL